MDDEIRQFKYIYQSTLAFEKFIREKLNKSKNVLDIGCGRAGTLSYYVKKYKKINFIGTDYRYKYISIAKKIYKKLSNPHLTRQKILKTWENEWKRVF